MPKPPNPAPAPSAPGPSPPPRPWPARERAVSHSRDLAVAIVLGVALGPGCGPDAKADSKVSGAPAAETAAAEASPADAGNATSAAGATSADSPDLFPEREGAMPISPESQAAIRELIAALEPVDDTVTSDVTDAWFIRHNKLVGDLVEADREIGVAALSAYASYKGGVSNVTRGLLTVAAHAAPEDSRDLLKTLMLEYGFPIDDRTVALRLLAETSPEVFLEHAERFLRRRGIPHETAPNDEFFTRGWVIACEKLDRSPVDVLADVVTNLVMEPAARHYAAEALGDYPDPVGRAALETAMIESTGNHYLRRKAAQALLASLPREDACTLFTHVMNHETDYNFQTFLRDVIEDNCR